KKQNDFENDFPPAILQNDSLQKTIEKTRQDVKPLTLFTGLAVMAVSFKKGKNLVPIVRKLAVTGSEYVAKGASKAASLATEGAVKVINLIKKAPLENPLKYTVKDENGKTIGGIGQAISKWADNARGSKAETRVANPIIAEGIPNFVGRVFGKKAGDKTSTFLKNNKIQNTKDLVDAACAMGIGIVAADKITDKVEATQDRMEIEQEEKRIRRTVGEFVKYAINNVGDKISDVIEIAGDAV
ncbi:hypothetical protein IJ670_07015, partial [bacterium]|nr:hypothetical protein [bacterium]